MHVASSRSLVGIGSRALEQDLSGLVDAAGRWDIDQKRGSNEVEFVLAHLDWRIIQAVVRADAERDVPLSFGVSSTVPFVDPVLEGMGFHRDLAVGAGGIGGVEPIRRTGWLNFNALDLTKLSLLCGVVVGVGPLCTVPCLSRNAHGSGKGVAVGLGHADARS